jgi:TP901 family phage tail tape measure protein
MAGINEIMVAITGNATGLKAALGEAETSTSGFASKLGGIGSIAAAGLGGAAVAIGAFALKSASDVGGAYKTIEKQTGETGTALTALKGNFNTVFSNVPEDANTVATALSDVYDKSATLNGGVKLTGQGLDDLTQKFLNWSRISGVSVTSLVDATTAWGGAWHMTSAQVSDSMDEVEKASQATHEDVSTLTADLQKMGPAATQLGLSFKETTADVAGFEEAGLKSTSITSAMNKTFSDATKAGKDAHTEWEQDIDTLTKYTTAVQSGNKAQAEAITKTSDWKQVTTDFSARTLTQLVTAVGEGKMSVADMNKMLENSSGDINKTASDTMTFGMKLDEFKNKLETAFAPLGISIINILTSFLNILTPIIPVITALISGFTSLPMPIQGVVMAAGLLVGGLGALNLVLGKFNMSITKLPADIQKVATALKNLDVSKVTSLLGMGGKAGGTGGFDSMLQTGEGAAVGGEGAEGGMLASLAPALLPVIAIVAAITAGFAILYATSKTFRDMISGVVTTLQNVLGWVQQIASALMSGNFSQAGDLLKQGFQGAIDSIKNFDFGAWAGKMVTSIQESAGTIGGILMGAFDTLKNIDWGGILYGILTAIDNLLTQAMNFDPTSLVNNLIDAIGGAFDSLFGGGSGGTAGAKASTGISGGLGKGMEKAGPDILGKLGDVFVKLVALLPTIFMKVGIALATALGKVDWGAVFGKLGEAIGNALGGIGDYLSKVDWGTAILGLFKTLTNAGGSFLTAILALFRTVNWLQIFTLIFVTIASFGQAIVKGLLAVDWGKGIAALLTAIMNLDWGGFAKWVWGELQLAIGAIVKWLEGLDWGGFAKWVWNQLQIEIGKIIAWIEGLDWKGFANTIWTDIQDALKDFGSWLLTAAENFFSGLPGKITSAISGFGAWLMSAAAGFFGGLPGAITSAIGGFGNWLLTAADGFFTGLPGKITSAVSGLGAWLMTAASGFFTGIPGAFSDAIGKVHVTLDTTAPFLHISTAAGGGLVSAVPGGVPVLVGEGGAPEAIIPQSMWWGVNPAVLNALPKFGGGGVIGNVSTSAVTTPGAAGNSGNQSVYYNVYVTVDSENVTNKVFQAIRELENYHHL